MRAVFFKPVGVRTPVDSPTYLGLSSQPEAEATTTGFSENLPSASGLDTGDFPEMTRGGLGKTGIGSLASILGGRMPVSLWKRPSETFRPHILGVRGPCSSALLHASSQHSTFGSPAGEIIAAGKS